MRHTRSQRKLGVWSSYRKMMLRNLATSLVKYGKVTTTEARSKELRRQIDWIMNVASKVGLPGEKEDMKERVARLPGRREVYSFFTTKEVARKALEEAPNKFKGKIGGGYTRQFKLGQRRGDSTELVLVQLDYEA